MSWRAASTSASSGSTPSSARRNSRTADRVIGRSVVEAARSDMNMTVLVCLMVLVSWTAMKIDSSFRRSTLQVALCYQVVPHLGPLGFQLLKGFLAGLSKLSGAVDPAGDSDVSRACEQSRVGVAPSISESAIRPARRCPGP